MCLVLSWLYFWNRREGGRAQLLKKWHSVRTQHKQIRIKWAQDDTQFSSVAQSCLTLCDPMDSSTPDFPVITNSQSLLKLMSIESVMPSNHLILCSPPPLLLHQSFPASGSCPMSQFYTSGGQSIGASAWVLPMNIRDWFRLGLTGLISLQSKGLTRVFSNTTV